MAELRRWLKNNILVPENPLLSNKITAILLIVATGLVVISLFVRQINQLYISLLTTAVIISGITLHFGEKIHTPSEPEGGREYLILTVASTLYGFIAALAIKSVFDNAITKSVIVEIGSSLNKTSGASFQSVLAATSNNQYIIFMMISFMVTAVPFYHGAMLFLSKKMTRDDQNYNLTLFVTFGFLFLESIIFLIFSLSMASYMLSLGALIGLMIVSSAWVIIMRYLYNKKDQKKTPPLGWLSLNLGFSAALFSTIQIGWVPQSSSEMLVIICIGRTVVDYVKFRKLYNLPPV